MRYKLLGKTGLKVSELCLGTMTFGEEWGWGSNKDVSRSIFEAFTQAGGNFLDTANVYTNGTSETLLGEFLAGRREQYVIATKYSLTERPWDANGSGNSRKCLMQALEGSLRRLKTDYIDLYFLHVWDFLTPVEEVMRAMDDAIRAGKVLYAGISDAPAWVVARGETIAELRGWSRVAAIQIPYSLVERTPEREIVPMANELDMAVTAWSPLAGGVLSGKYRRGQAKPAETRFSGGGDWSDYWLTEHNIDIAEAVCELAQSIGRSPAQVALNWLRQRSGVVIPIIGARRLDQIRDNLACLEFTLSNEQLAHLHEVSRIEPGYPGNFYQVAAARHLVYGDLYDQIEDHRHRKPKVEQPALQAV